MSDKPLTDHIGLLWQHYTRTIMILLSATPFLLSLSLPAHAALSDPWTMWEFMRNYTGQR